jgi:ribosomal protein S18 acetylase RimI-like enzyme
VPADRQSLVELVSQAAQFTPDEVACAVELIDAALENPLGDYRLLLAEMAGDVVGYVCYGPTPMTVGTWDLYWIATHPRQRGRGVATALVEGMEADVRAQDGRRVRVETSHQTEYRSAHRFYERNAYPEVARLRDFYKPGDDLVIMLKVL